jgi:hypothetical protein
MKLLGYLLLVCVIGWATCQDRNLAYKLGAYNSIGLLKSRNGTEKEFKTNFLQIFSDTRYIEFYDISQPFNKIVLNSYLTLSQIKLRNITFDKKALSSNLTFSDNELNITNPEKELNLKFTAEMTANWGYKIGISEINHGTFTALLEADKTKFSFNFFTNYSKSTATINNEWKIIKSDIKGYGAYKEIHEGLKDMVDKNLVPKINEELGKYGTLLLDLMIYSRSFRKMAIKANHVEENRDAYTYVLMNEVSGLNKPNKTFPLDIMFNGYILNEQTHKKRILNNTNFKPDIKNSSDIVLFFNSSTLAELPRIILEDSFEILLIDNNTQQKLFNQTFKIKTLTKFYPRISEEYNPETELELTCTLLNNKTSVVYTCAFSLVETKDIVFHIDKLEWKPNYNITVDKENSTHPSTFITLNTETKSFSSIKIKSVQIEEFAARQLMFFLNPLTDYLVKRSGVSLYTTSPRDNLAIEFEEISEGYVAIFYKFKE